MFVDIEFQTFRFIIYFGDKSNLCLLFSFVHLTISLSSSLSGHIYIYIYIYIYIHVCVYMGNG